VGHVAGAGVGVADLGRAAGQRGQPGHQAEQAVALAAGDVEDPAGGPGRGAGPQVGLDDVIDEGEVPALVAVAVNGGPLALPHGGDEPGNDRGVLGARILARAGVRTATLARGKTWRVSTISRAWACSQAQS
jgi:hypothetical protein